VSYFYTDYNDGPHRHSTHHGTLCSFTGLQDESYAIVSATLPSYKELSSRKLISMKGVVLLQTVLSPVSPLRLAEVRGCLDDCDDWVVTIYVVADNL
jgi:hypothetical protein